MRAWISAELDGELSEFESILVDGHVSRCGACGDFRTDGAEIATRLRAAPPELPSRPIAVPRGRRRLLQPVRVPAVAAAAVLAVTLGGVFASLHSAEIVGGRSTSAETAFENNRDVQLQRKQAANAALRARRAVARSAAVPIPRRRGFIP